MKRKKLAKAHLENLPLWKGVGKLFAIIFVLSFTSLNLQAQTSAGNYTQNVHKKDTIPSNAFKAKDSITQKHQSINAQNFDESLVQGLQTAVDTLETKGEKITGKVQDSLHAIKPFKKINNTVMAAEDSLSQEFRSSNIVSTTDSLYEKLGENPIHPSPSKRKPLDEKIGTLNKSSDDYINKIKEMEAVQEFQGYEQKVTGVTDKVKEYDQNIKELTDTPGNYPQEIKNNEELQEHINEAKNLGKDYDEYGREMKSIAQGNIPKTKKISREVEQKVNDIEEIQALKQEASEMKAQPEQYQKKIGQYQDAKYLKSQLKNEVKKASVRHFSGQEEKLKGAMDKLEEYKKRYINIQKYKDGPEKRDSPLRGKPLKERLIFGGNFQVHTDNPVALDISPLIGYRFTPEFSAGIGGTYRQSFKRSESTSHSMAQDVFGFRAFTEYIVVKSFFIHAELESMHMKKADTVGGARKWANGALAGAGKEFTISKNVKGKVMLLYNFLHNKNGPYQKPLMVRFGFDF